MASRIPPALVAAAFVGMAALTWRGWPDPFVDYGASLETARRLALGEVLYRDVAALHGPFSAEMNALLFRLLGAHVWVAEALGLAVAASAAALVFALVRRAAGPAAAASSGILFVTAFAFGQYTPAATYNWVCPYVPEITHGLALALLALLLLDRASERGMGTWAAAGVAAGFCFLTKAEVFVALAAAAAAFFVSLPASRREGRAFGAFAGAFLAPPAAFFLLYAARGGPALGLRAVLGPWAATLNTKVSALPFFAEVAGTGDAKGNLLRLAVGSLSLAGLVGLGAAAAFLASRRPLLALLLPIAALAFLAAAWKSPAWLEAPRALPVAAAVLLVLAWRSVGSSARPLRVAGAALGLVLLGKVLLNGTVARYGFVLAVPAAAALAAALTGILPDAVSSHGGDGRMARSWGAALLGLFAVACVARTATRFGTRTEWAGSGADAFRGDARTAALRAAVAEVEAMVPAGGTLAVLPEGAMVNFLTRRRNPTPYLAIMPVEEAAYGDRIPEAYRRAPPDYVLLVHKDTSEFGAPAFGRDYAKSLGAFLTASYEPVSLLGAEPFAGPAFGMKLLARRGR